MQGSTAGRDAKPGKSLSILLLLVLLSGCDSDLKRAHRANQQGIALDRLGQHAAAIRQYQRSRAFDQRLHVPTYNMARSHALAGRHAQAHTVYQEVLELVPDLVEAHYNDGLALFAWGEAERDPEGCQLERTLDLWRRAEERFEHAAELAKGASLESQARANQAEIARLLAVYRALAEDPPEACTQSSSSSAPDASGSGAGRGGGGQPLEDPSSPSGSGQPPSSGGGASGGSGGGSDRSGGFSAEQNEQIRSARERIAEASRGVGKYHRRTLAEQFPPDSWKQPEPVILW